MGGGTSKEIIIQHDSTGISDLFIDQFAINSAVENLDPDRVVGKQPF